MVAQGDAFSGSGEGEAERGAPIPCRSVQIFCTRGVSLFAHTPWRSSERAKGRAPYIAARKPPKITPGGLDQDRMYRRRYKS